MIAETHKNNLESFKKIPQKVKDFHTVSTLSAIEAMGKWVIEKYGNKGDMTHYKNEKIQIYQINNRTRDEILTYLSTEKEKIINQNLTNN